MTSSNKTEGNLRAYELTDLKKIAEPFPKMTTKYSYQSKANIFCIKVLK